MDIEQLKQKALSLTMQPGVYLMKDKQGEIIYVGKAKALKNRVVSYFRQNSSHNEKVRKMVSMVNDFDYIVTASEFEALVLECSLIKQYNPKYNILLKDDKGYHYIHISDEEYPRISAALQKTGNGTYLGPYTSGFVVKQTVEQVNKIFRLPTCSRKFPQDFRKGRPCLNFHIKQCVGLCQGKMSKEEYHALLDDAMDYIRSGGSVNVDKMRDEMEKLGSVSLVSMYYSRDWCDNVYVGNTAFSGSLYGVDDHYLTAVDYAVNYGRSFTAADYENRRNVALIDAKSAKSLFQGENPIGGTIEINGMPFTVVGVVSSRSSSGPVINNFKDYQMYAGSTAGTIFIPDVCWSVPYRYDEPQYAAVRATSTNDMTAAGDNVAKYLNENAIRTTKYKYESKDLLQQASDLQSLSESTNKQLIWIAAISLVVGGIGVMNIMLVSVTERTREIGLKIAIGAQQSRILWQFLTEAAVLTSMGGILGVATGIGLAEMMSHIMGTPVAISVPACIIAVAFSMVIGVVFGLVPAMKASKLNPIEALRRE